MRRVLRTIAFVAAATLLTGCASLTRGSTEMFFIETTPVSATATLSTGQTCTTPCMLEVKRRGDFVVNLTMPGYETLMVNVSSAIDGEGTAGMAGNLLFGGIIGAGIDAGTGAMHSHQPNPLIVTLAASGASAADTAVPTDNDAEPQ